MELTNRLVRPVMARRTLVEPFEDDRSGSQVALIARRRERSD
jgi:hypothetical protein